MFKDFILYFLNPCFVVGEEEKSSLLSKAINQAPLTLELGLWCSPNDVFECTPNPRQISSFLRFLILEILFYDERS